MALLGSGRGRHGRLAVERRPADSVTQPLVIQHKIADRIRQLLALPLTFLPTGAFTLAVWHSRAYRLDCVGRSTELVCGDMRHRCRLAGSMRGVPSGSAQLSCRSVGSAGRRAGLRHLNLAARPCPSLFDRLAGPRVRRLHRLEKVQNVLCARGRPQGEKLMVQIRERPATADSDEARVAVLGENYGYTCPSCICPTY